VQMRGGGVVHGPVMRSHEHDLPKKVRRMGLKCALAVCSPPPPPLPYSLYGDEHHLVNLHADNKDTDMD